MKVIYEDHQHNLWIGTEDDGLYRLKNGVLNVFTGTGGMNFKDVRSIFEDEEGSLWLGTYYNGLNRLKDGPITSYSTLEGLSDPHVRTIFQDRKGHLWVGTENGLNVFQDSNFRPFAMQKQLIDNHARTVFESSDGALWIGTESGLNLWKDGKMVSFTTSDGLSENIITTIMEDWNHYIWVGTINGLNILKNRHVISFSLGNHMADNKVRALYQDRSGKLWIATDNGVRYMPDGEIGKFIDVEALSGNMVMDVIGDNDGDYLWFSVVNGGLIRYRISSGTTEAVTEKDGLYNDSIYRILNDDLGHFWMSCNKGIFKVSREELVDFCEKKIERVTCEIFNENHGMKIRECNGATQPAGWKSADGKLWFPTVNGVAMIDPVKSKINKIPPPVIIEEIVVDEKVKGFHKMQSSNHILQLPPGTDRIKIKYTALSFYDPGKVKFKYQLLGHDRDWMPETNERKVSYTNLSPGQYTFLVRACNNDGVWNKTGETDGNDTSISFYQQPFYYQTWWFLALCGFFGIFAGLTGYKLRVRRLKSRAEYLRIKVREQTKELREKNEELTAIMDHLEQKVEERTAQLTETNSQLTIAKDMAEKANRAKSQFLTNMSHEIRTPMNAVLGFTEILESEITEPEHRKFLDAISSSGKILLALINDILDLSRIEAGKMELQLEPVNPRGILLEMKRLFFSRMRKKGLDFQTYIHPDVPESLFLDGLRIKQILFNLIGNALKFTQSGFVHLDLHKRCENSDTETVDLVFTIKDSGIGIPENQQETIFKAFTQQDGQCNSDYGGTGLGLTITRRLAQMMKGDITVTSKEGEGSQFFVTIPKVAVSHMPVPLSELQEMEVENINKPPLQSEEISSQSEEDLIQLLAYLRSDSITQQWEQLSRTLILDEIETFCQEMKECAERYRSGSLSRWTDQLNQDIQSFDIPRIRTTLSAFTQMIEVLSEKLQPKV